MDYLAAFIFAFTIVVVAHELGHLFAAKALGVKVYEFSIGFPFSPKVATLFRVKETAFTVRLLPLGGFVAFSKDGEEDPSGYLRLEKWKRAVIAFSGPAFNIALAFTALWLSSWSASDAIHSMHAAVTGFVGLFSNSGGPGLLDSLSGPVGIAVAAGEAAQSGAAGFLFFTGMLSLSLAILNLLPFPALDGGQIAMLALEALRRKDFSPAAHGAITAAGIFLFIALTVLVSYRDIYRLAI